MESPNYVSLNIVRYEKKKAIKKLLPDSNRRPTHYECGALPAELQKLISDEL